MMKILSLLIGFISGIILMTIYITRFNYVYHGPDSNDVKKRIYQDDQGSCYKYVPKTYICPLVVNHKK